MWAPLLTLVCHAELWLPHLNFGIAVWTVRVLSESKGRGRFHQRGYVGVRVETETLMQTRWQVQQQSDQGADERERAMEGRQE